MSSFKRIPKDKIQKSTEELLFDGSVPLPETQYKQSVMDAYRNEMKERVKEEEARLMKELAAKRERFRKSGYEEGKRLARQEVMEEVEKACQEKIQQAERLYQQANDYYKEMLQQEEMRRKRWKEEEKEEVISFLRTITEKIIGIELEMRPEKIEDIYQHVLRDVTYQTKKLLVHMHPDTERVLREKGMLPDDPQLLWLRDTALSFGDFVVETDMEWRDHRVSHLLQEVEAFLKEEGRHG